MVAYAFCGELFCQECTDKWFAYNAGRSTPAEDNSCSETFPQGPIADGGGEADSPSHCDSCGKFLENPLTTDGLQYVREAFDRCGDRLDVWGPFYLPAEWSALKG